MRVCVSVSADNLDVGRIEDEILGIAAVRQIQRKLLIRLLEKAKVDWQIIEELLQRSKLVRLRYNENEYYRVKPT